MELFTATTKQKIIFLELLHNGQTLNKKVIVLDSKVHQVVVKHLLLNKV